MDVRCKLLGHVRDSTEFEERHEDRPRGTVLICREFQVCRRCGDREEMYRNEQVLSPDPDEVGQDVEERPAALENRGSEGGENRGTERSAGGPPETPDGEPDVGGGGLQEATETAPDGAAGTDEPRPANTDDETADTAASTTGADDESPAEPDDAGQVTDNGVILSDASTGPGSPDNTPNKQAVADGRGRTAADRGGDDSPTSLFDAGDEDSGEIHCNNCGREWDVDETSLREGDICPECRGAYVAERR